MLQDLPELVLDLICEHLSYEDLLVLRSTCKGLKGFVDGKQFTKLNLFIRKYSFHHRLFYTDELICSPHSYHSNNLSILDASRFREQFTNVQRMIICSKRQSHFLEESAENFDLKLLHCFAALRHLEISDFFCIKGKLNLQELRVASFHNFVPYEFIRNESRPILSSELDCPKLKILGLSKFKPVLTSATNQLEYLHYGHYDDPTDYLKSISRNLRRLSTICFVTTACLLEFLCGLKTSSLSLPLLCQIKLDEDIDLEFSEKLNEMASNLEDLKRNPVNSLKKQIQFSFNGRPIRHPDELRQIASLIRAYDSEAGEENELDLSYLTDRTLLFLNANSELEFLLSAVSELSLSEDTEVSEQLIKKLKNITRIEFEEECKPSNSTFELFARSCKSLCSLTLHQQVVTERLLEMMANHLVNLQSLVIAKCQFETVKPLTKFRNLESIYFDFVPPKSELIFIFKNSRTVEVVTIRKEPAIYLLRMTIGQKVHKIGWRGSDPIEFHTLQDMIDWYYFVIIDGITMKL